MLRVPTDACLFCLKNDGPFISEEHIVLESVANEKIVLPAGIVCDPCNFYFSSQIDNHFANHYAGVVQKLLYLKETKKGKPPKITLIDQGEGKRELGGRLSFRQNVLEGKEEDQTKLIFTADAITLCGEFYLPPADAKIISRFLAKAGLEILFYKSGDVAFAEVYNPIRNYARYGQPKNRFIPFSWHKDTWCNADVRQLIIQSKTTPGAGAALTLLQVPGAVYLINLNCSDELWALQKAQELLVKELQVEDFKFELVEKPGSIIPEPIRYSFTYK